MQRSSQPRGCVVATLAPNTGAGGMTPWASRGAPPGLSSNGVATVSDPIKPAVHALGPAEIARSLDRPGRVTKCHAGPTRSMTTCNADSGRADTQTYSPVATAIRLYMPCKSFRSATRADSMRPSPYATSPGLDSMASLKASCSSLALSCSHIGRETSVKPQATEANARRPDSAKQQVSGWFGSRDRTRTYNLPVNSRTLCRLSYAGPMPAGG